MPNQKSTPKAKLQAGSGIKSKSASSKTANKASESKSPNSKNDPKTPKTPKTKAPASKTSKTLKATPEVSKSNSKNPKTSSENPKTNSENSKSNAKISSVKTKTIKSTISDSSKISEEPKSPKTVEESKSTKNPKDSKVLKNSQNSKESKDSKNSEKPDSSKSPKTPDQKSDSDKSNIAKIKSSPAKNSKTSKSSFFTPLNILGKLLALLLSLSLILLLSILSSLNILPTKYLLPLTLILTLITLLCAIFDWRKSTKKLIKIPTLIISFLFSGIYLIASGYLIQTSSFLDNLKPQEQLTEHYYVLVKNDSIFQNIHDLENKTIETYDEKIDIYYSALEKLNSTVNVKIKNVDSFTNLTDNLLNNKTDAIFLSAIHKTTLEEDYENFSSLTRVLYTIEIAVNIDEEVTHPVVNVMTEPFNVFISGADSYGSISDRSRSDVNMIATINPKTHEILLTSIPRDYYVQLSGTTGTKDKLTHAGIYGVRKSMQTISELLDIKIDYYVKVNFSTLVKLVDTIGGIEVYSDQSFIPWTNQSLRIPEGNVHMDGATAIAFARERKSYATGDRHRVQNQQDVLKAIINKITSSSVILTKYSEILNDLSSTLETNLSKSEISGLVRLQLQDMPSWKISEYQLNGSDAHDYTYSFGKQKLYVMVPDQNTVTTAHKYITGIMSGQTFAELGLK